MFGAMSMGRAMTRKARKGGIALGQEIEGGMRHLGPTSPSQRVSKKGGLAGRSNGLRSIMKDELQLGR